MISNHGFTPHPNSKLSVLIGCCASPCSHLFYTFVWQMGGGTLQFKRGSPKLELPLCFLSHLLAHSACCTFVTQEHTLSGYFKDCTETKTWKQYFGIFSGIVKSEDHSCPSRVHLLAFCTDIKASSAI